MRITSRTPPVRIAAADMMALAALPAEHAGLLLRWGMRRYADGMGVSVADARADAAMDDRAWATLLHMAKPLLDQEALDAGTIVVAPFAAAADNLARVSASKVRAPVSRDAAVKAIAFAAARAAGGSDATPTRQNTTRPDTRTDGGVVVTAAPVSVPPTTPGAHSDPWWAIARQLVARGSSEADVEDAVHRWRARYSPGDVIDCLQNTTERRIAKPVKYVETMLSNMDASRRSAMPAPVRSASQGSLLPRPVKRKIRVGPRAGWTFEGWTARGHQRGGETVEERKEVWRNEAGGLSYKTPDPESTRPIPTYDEDPGLYEAD